MATDAAPARQRSGFSLAVGDALATSFFVFVSSTFEEASVDLSFPLARIDR